MQLRKLDTTRQGSVFYFGMQQRKIQQVRFFSFFVSKYFAHQVLCTWSFISFFQLANWSFPRNETPITFHYKKTSLPGRALSRILHCSFYHKRSFSRSDVPDIGNKVTEGRMKEQSTARKPVRAIRLFSITGMLPHLLQVCSECKRVVFTTV